MKNLKRALSFVMASAMLVGMMVVGSSAVAFGDADQIKNTEAVNTLVALGVLKGKDTGNFDPTGIVTRAEMAKMICVAYNGGKDPNLTEGGMYNDTKSHWARGYIDYCTNLGVVAGDTAGNFNPDKTVTGTEAAKMILVALGYNAVQEKFVNDDHWANNINVLANQKGLYDDLSVFPSQGLTRDAAAQMIWNGMNAKMVKYTIVGIANGNSVSRAEDFDDGRTILSNKFKMEEDEGLLTEISYTEDSKNGNYYTYTISDDMIGTNGEGYDFADDCSHLFGMKVKVLYKKDNNNNVKVFGMFAEGSNVMLETTLNNMEWKANATDTIVVSKKDYKIPGKETVVVSLTNGYDVDHNKTMNDVLNSKNIVGEGFAAPNAIKVIDNNGDKKADVAVVTSIKVAKVTFVNKTTVTTDNSGSYKFDECDIYNGVAVDDYVQITTGPKNNKPALTKLTAINGVIAGVTENEKGLLDEIKVDGTWLYVMGSEDNHSVVPLAGETYDLVVVNGFVYYSEQVSESKTLSDVIYLSDAEHSTGVSDAKAKVYFMDGSSATITLSKVNDVSIKDEKAATALESKLYTFTVKNNAYTLTSLSADNKVGFDGYGVMDKEQSTLAAESKKYGNYTIADDAVVIAHQTAAVVDGDDTKDATVKFYTGKQAKKFSTAFGEKGYVLYNTVKGIDTAKLVVLVAEKMKAPSTAGTESYGYLTAKPFIAKVDGTSYVQYTMWTKSGSVTVLEEKSSVTEGLKKGIVVTYDDLGDGKVEKVEPVGEKGAITGMNSDELVIRTFNKEDTSKNRNGAYTINSDTKYLYIDSDAGVGVEGGSVNLATKVAKKDAVKDDGSKYADDVYQNNVWFVLDGEDEKVKVTLVVVDVNNNVGGYTADYKE